MSFMMQLAYNDLICKDCKHRHKNQTAFNREKWCKKFIRLADFTLRLKCCEAYKQEVAK